MDRVSAVEHSTGAGHPTGTGRSGSIGSRGARWRVRGGALIAAAVTALGACVVALVVGGGGPTPVPDGLPDAGALTGWGLRLVSLLVQLCAVLAVGSLLVGAVLLPTGAARGARLDGDARRSVAAAGHWAAGSAVLGAVAFVFVVSDTAGVPPTDLTLGLLQGMSATDQGRALLLLVLASATIARTAGRVSTVRGSRVLLLAAIAALIPSAVVGHASSSADQSVAASGLVVHVVAASVWVGGLAGIVLQLRRSPRSLAVAVPRFSVIAMAAYGTLVVSGLISATTRLDTTVSAWTSGYGAIVALKASCGLALGYIGHLHRRRTVPRLRQGGSGAFVRLACVELVLMGAAMGLAAALSRTPAPPTPVAAAPTHGVGHSTLPVAVDPVSLGELATAWRLDALALVVLGLALAAYAAGVRSLARRGVRWPVLRTTAFAAGLLLALLDLCSGVATYAPALVSVQIAQLLVALLVVPVLLLAGAPLTLWWRVRTHEDDLGEPVVPHSPALGALANPVAGAALTCALLLGLYRTPLIELSLRSAWVHLLVVALALASGLILLWPVLGVDAVPRPTRVTERVACLGAVIGCLALLAVQLRYGGRLLAGEWFLELRWGWNDPVADQRIGGAVAAAAAAGMLVLVVVVLARRERGVPRPQRVTGHTRSSTRPSTSSPAIAP